MMENSQLKSNKLNFSKSQTNLNLNLSTQSAFQQYSKQKSIVTMSPKNKVDQILNSLNTYKMNLGRKENHNLGRVSQIFTHEHSLSQYKEEKSFTLSNGTIITNHNLSKDHSIKALNQRVDNLKIKQQNSANSIHQSSKIKVDSYQLNRIRSTDTLQKLKFQTPKSIQNSQKNVLNSSSSQSNILFSIQHKKNSLEAIKEKLVKYGIKLNSRQNNQEKYQQKQKIQQKQCPKGANKRSSIQNYVKLGEKDSQIKIIISNPKKSQFLNQKFIDSIKQKQISFTTSLKQCQSLKTFNIPFSPQKNDSYRQQNSSPIKSVKRIDSVTDIRKNHQKKFSPNVKQLIDSVKQNKIGQPKLAAFKNSNKNSQIINQKQEKSLNVTIQQKNTKSLRKQLSISSFLNPLNSQGSNKQNFDLKQTMQTDYAYANTKNKLSINDFKLGRQIGKGKFGRVFLTRHCQTGFLCAMKIIKKETIRKQRNLEQLIRQIKIQSFLNHSNSVKMYGFFDDKENIYLLIEYCMDGQLYSQLKLKKKLNEQEAIPIIKDVCQGLNNLHGLGIIHRDIKPQNIVLSLGMAKLCDFGWSVNCQNEKRQTFCGTPLYVSPQLLMGKAYDYKVDVWALGILSYELLTGKLPFQIMSEKQLKKIVTNQVQYPQYISENGKDFIRHLLHKNPTYRNDLDTVLKHKFLIEGMEKLRNKKKKQTN